MIYLINGDKEKYFKEYIKSNNSIYTVKIYSRYINYINDEIIDMWVQVIDFKPTAIISSSDGYITIDTNKIADKKEIVEFIKMIGYKEILSDYKFNLFEKNVFSGYVMKYNYENLYTEELDISYNVEYNNYKSAYSVLNICRSDNFLIPTYEDFILDMSFKVRRNSGQVLTIKYKDKSVATASVIYSCSYGAIIGAVAVDSEYRNRGVGKNLISILVNNLIELNIKNIYLQCNTERNRKFYESLNFKEHSKFSNITYEVTKNV